MFGITAGLIGADVQAEVPRVAADIAPVHSLAARVMQGVGAPDLIVPAGATPHEYSLRPSEADALQSADAVFWLGDALTPWLEDAIESLAPNASVVTLTDVESVHLLDTREGVLFEVDAHADDAHAPAKHADHRQERGGHVESEHARDDHPADESHAADDGAHAIDAADTAGANHDEDGQGSEHAHAHGAFDPHAWLSPHNAKRWLDAMAAELSRLDPANAEAYASNAAAAREELEALEAAVIEHVAPVRDMRFVVFHDAYQYFEDAFGLSVAGAISLSDASAPSPARIDAIQRRIRDEDIGCVLAEPQFNDALVATVTDRTDIRTAVLDPLGAGLEPGPSLYPGLLRDLAESLNDCL